MQITETLNRFGIAYAVIDDFLEIRCVCGSLSRIRLNDGYHLCKNCGNRSFEDFKKLFEKEISHEEHQEDIKEPESEQNAFNEGGFIKLWRKSLNNIAFQNAELWQLWTYCLLKSNYKDGWKSVSTGRGTTQVFLKRGQLVYQRNQTASELNQKPFSLYNRLLNLEKNNQLNIQKNTHYSIVTVCNYDFYQSKENSTKHPNEHPTKHTNEHNINNYLSQPNEQQLNNINQQDTYTTKHPTKHPMNTQLLESIDSQSVSAPKNSKEYIKKEKRESQKNFASDSLEFKLSMDLLNSIKNIKPDFKKPNIQTWCKNMDYMLRLDKREPEKIKTVINWIFEGENKDALFWRKNILSTEGLRRNFDKAEIQMLAAIENQPKQPKRPEIFSAKDYQGKGIPMPEECRERINEIAKEKAFNGR